MPGYTVVVKKDAVKKYYEDDPELIWNDKGHQLDSLLNCIYCNGCVKPGCMCANMWVCCYRWQGGLPAKVPVQDIYCKGCNRILPAHALKCPKKGD